MRILSSLSSRIVVFSSIMVLITSTLIASVVFIMSRGILVEHAKESLRGEANLLTIEIQNSFDSVTKDLLMLSKTPPIMGIVRSKENNGMDTSGKSSLESWKSRLSVIFSSVLQVNQNYTQIRYLGVADNGKELVRVDRTRNEIYRIPDAKLQMKKAEGYFQKGIKLTKGSIIFSEVSYNRENGVIQNPLTPTIRAIMPVYSADHVLFGLLVINVNYELFVKNILEKAKAHSNIILFNDEGDYFQYNSANKDLQFYHNEDTGSHVNQIQSVINYISSTEGVISQTKKIFTNESKSKPLLTLFISANKDALFKSDSRVLNNIFIMIVLISFAAVLFTTIFSRWLMRHFRTMADVVNTAAPSELSDVLPTELHDEVGLLARSFVKKADELSEMAMRDSLTDLANRKAFMQHLEHAVERAKESGMMMAVCFIDLDKFKEVNDQHGHDVGDELLIRFSKDLKTITREGDFVSRLGGDEFAVIIEGLSNNSIVKKISSRYCSLLKDRVYTIDGIELILSGSVGVSVYPKDGDTAELLLNKADDEMYKDKANRRRSKSDPARV